MKTFYRSGKRFSRPIAVCLFLFILLGAVAARGQSVPLPGQTAAPLPGGASEENQTDSGNRFNIKFGGYLENTINAEHIRSDDTHNYLNITKARLNFSVDFSSFASFGLAVVGEANMGDRFNYLTNLLPKEVEDSIPIQQRSAFVDKRDDVDAYFQEAFVTLTFSSGTFRLGRHKFYSGTGYAYNPIDLFNRKNPLDPTYETKGQDAAMLSLSLSPVAELELTARADEDHSYVDFQTRLKYYHKGWDLALQYTRHINRRYDWALDGRAIDFTWNLIALEFSGEIGGVGIHGEGGYAFIDEPEYTGSLTRAGMDHERFLIGVDYTFENQLYVLLEYMRFGQGRDDPDDMTLNDRFAYLTGEIITSNTDTLYLGLRYPLTDLLDISLYSIVNCNDPSVILNPWLIWDVHPGWKLSASMTIPLGEEDSSLGRMGVSGLLRLRFSF